MNIYKFANYDVRVTSDRRMMVVFMYTLIKQKSSQTAGTGNSFDLDKRKFGKIFGPHYAGRI